MVCSENTAEKLVSWFRENARPMPWREEPTPYHVWVSEIMLQQTRVDTVIPYYLRFVRELPDVSALAACEEDRLLKLWEGLGYYSRVRNLQKAAKICVAEYGKEVPDTYEALLKLPGIGTYTAGAVASIAYHLKTPVVDGNVLRVLSRLNASEKDIRDPATKSGMERELSDFLQSAPLDPREFNQGLMELGALVCLPNGAPKCSSCPWQEDCAAYRDGLTDRIPVASPKQTAKTVPLTVLIYTYGKEIGIEKRTGKGLLSALYGLPVLEGHLTEEALLSYLSEEGLPYTSVQKLPPGKHVFTHRVWEMDAYRVRLSGKPPGLLFSDLSGLEDRYALPSAFKKWNFTELFENE